MELRVSQYQPAERISFNYEELKSAVQEKMLCYQAAIYTDDQIKDAKADKATLNKLRKALNDERIRMEREYMEPFNAFKGQINEIIGIIDKSILPIDKQVRDFEERRKAEKEQQIIECWKAADAPEWLYTVKSSWLNASYALKTIQAEIAANVEQAAKDLAVIRALPAYAFEAEEHYKHTRSLAEAVSEAHRLQEMAERKAAFDAEMAERRAKREAAQQSITGSAFTETATPAAPAHQWISFKALLSLDDAKALKEFFNARGIEFERI